LNWSDALRDLGLSSRFEGDLPLILIAGSLALLGWAAGWGIGRLLGPLIAQQLRDRTGALGAGLVAPACALVRHATAALAFAVALNAYPWPVLGTFFLGFGLALAVALLIADIARAVQLSRWVMLPLAAVAFAAILTDSVRGIKSLTSTLDQVGFAIGDHRLTLLGLLTATVTIIALYAAVRLANRVIGHSIRHARGLDATQGLLAEKLAGIAVLVAAFFIGIDLLGIDLTALTVFSGAFGLAVGFGLQKTFGNLIAGIILLMDRSIKPGDVIVVGDSFGSVNKIGVRAVSILTRDGKEHLIPNENLMTQEVENWSYSDRNVRVHIPVSVAYECDIHLAQKLMIEAANASSRVLPDPKPGVWLRGFGDNAVEHDIMVWVADPELGIGNVKSDVLNRVWDLFKANGIAIPYPQRDIHIRDWPAASASADAT
jgi:small-conductance mechanosensitive channel